MITIAVWLAIVGLCVGSFVNALVWRLHKNKDWIRERSQCPHCGHQLAAQDLVPIFSWLFLRGRCRYCKKAISKQYPLIEIAGGLIFVLSYIFWPTDLNQTGNLILFITYLICSVGLLAILVYDWLYMLVPTLISLPMVVLAAAGRLVYILAFSHNLAHSLIQWILTLVIASGIFAAMYLISRGRWIGDGDITIGLITGSLLPGPGEGLLMIFLASILGTMVALPSLLSGQRKMTTRIPYGPFLIAATFICVLFGTQIIDWYRHIFLP